MSTKKSTELTERDLQQINEQINKKPRRRVSNSSNLDDTTTATRPEISDILKNSLYWRGVEPVRTDRECLDRINMFFAHCAETGELPSTEKMALALGVTRQTLWNWQRGTQGAARKDIIAMAKEVLASIDAELVNRNKIPQVVYIFRAKNYFGMSNKTEVVLAPTNPLESTEDREQLQARYARNVPFEESDDE